MRRGVRFAASVVLAVGVAGAWAAWPTTPERVWWVMDDSTFGSWTTDRLWSVPDRSRFLGLEAGPAPTALVGPARQSALQKLATRLGFPGLGVRQYVATGTSFRRDARTWVEFVLPGTEPAPGSAAASGPWDLLDASGRTWRLELQADGAVTGWVRAARWAEADGVLGVSAAEPVLQCRPGLMVIQSGTRLGFHARLAPDDATAEGRDGFGDPIRMRRVRP